MSKRKTFTINDTIDSNLVNELSHRQIRAVRITTAPKIDGALDEEFWNQLPIAERFTELYPDNGAESRQKSEVRLAYDNSALYVGAMLYDNQPDSILTYLSKRDEFSLADMFGIYLDPFNDGLYALGFFVSASGVQIDMKANGDSEDQNWDAVWESEVKITDIGWAVEMKIPYSALRFPVKDQQTWGVNMFRHIQRYRANNSWSYIDRKKSGFLQQNGQLLGIQNIKPPMRLSFTPYFSTSAQHSTENPTKLDYSFKGGMDLKYGINESFTLDMMLIPDFGQVQSDDSQLNLSPFETYYEEKRPFFTEGTEMFQKAGIFYSRRIGGSPIWRDDVEDKLVEGEEIIENPREGRMINATKISGKTTRGLGIGFLNAVIANTYATVKDSITGKERKIKTQPYSNYNLVVFDQSLKNNSYISLINTNVTRPDDNNYMANVTGAEFRLSNAKQTYAISGKGAINQIVQKAEDNSYGHYYSLTVGKTSGKFRTGFTHKVESQYFNPNDFGYLQNPNELTNSVYFQYNIYNPILNGKILRWYNYVNISNSSLYEPRKYNYSMLKANSNLTFKNNLSIGSNINTQPFKQHNYTEARVDNRAFIAPAWINPNAWFSTDYSKKVAVDISAGFWDAFDDPGHGYWYNVSPRLQLSDKFLAVWSFNDDRNYGDLGYVNNNDNEDSIYFGSRNLHTLTNTLNLSYIFSNKSSLTLRARHYWSKVVYKQFFLLKDDGNLKEYNNYTEDEDINYNSFNLDVVYSWNFAPGSELLLVWKGAIDTDNEKVAPTYMKDLKTTFDAERFNNFSIKILYYLDYQYLKRG